MLRIAFLGDIVILLLFAGLGRSSHHEASGVLATLGVAAPFLSGWFLAAIWTRPYAPPAFRSPRHAIAIAVRTWLLGCAIGLLIRSLVEGHVTPLSFVLVALIFNGILICAWHALVARAR